MKKAIITVIIERNADAFYAYVSEIDGCTAGGESFDEVKKNMEEILSLVMDEDDSVKDRYHNGYDLIFEVIPN